MTALRRKPFRERHLKGEVYFACKPVIFSFATVSGIPSHLRMKRLSITTLAPLLGREFFLGAGILIAR
jgi:hypothetical protein